MSTTEHLYSDLVEWEGNPRPAASAEERNEMRASLEHVGQIMPIIGRPKDGKVEIVAGRNRMRSIGELIAESRWDAAKPVLVHVRDLTDEEALEIATSENINIPMHPMHQFEAFRRMIDMGKDVTTVANTYGVSERVVERRLSYAKLDERARDLVKSNERDLDWASAMTLASPTEQAAILDEIEADSRRFRNANDVRSRLQDDLVPLSYALFDSAVADDKLVRRDLFDPNDESYMTRKDFLPLQDQALKDSVEADRKAGWSDVLVISDKDFDIYKYVDGVTDMDKGMVIFVRHGSGEIVRYAGMALRYEERLKTIDKEHAEAADALFGGDDDEAAVDALRGVVMEESDEDIYVEGPKTTKHLGKERAAIIQKMMLEDQKAANVVVLAGLIGASAARPLEGRAYSDLTDLDEASPARRAIEDRAHLSHDILRNAGIDVMGSYQDLVRGLYGLDDRDLAIVYQSEIARRITTDLGKLADLSEALLEVTGTKISDHWTIDRTFLGTLSVKALRGLGADILPTRLHGKLGKGKADAIETLAGLGEDARSEGGRLDATERRALLDWAPTALGGKQFSDLGGESIFEADEGADIFGDDEEDGAEARFAA